MKVVWFLSPAARRLTNIAFKHLMTIINVAFYVRGWRGIRLVNNCQVTTVVEKIRRGTAKGFFSNFTTLWLIMLVTLYVCMYSSSSSATRALSENYHRHLQTRTPYFQGCVRWITYQTRVIFCWNIWKNLALKGQINFKQTHLPSIIMFWESFSYNLVINVHLLLWV